MGFYDAFPSQGVTAGGGALKVMGDIYASGAKADSLETQANLTEASIKELGFQSDYEDWRRNVALRHGEGTQRATYANLGLQITGTAMDNLVEMAKNMTLDKMMARRNAQVRQEMLGVEATQYRKAAGVTRDMGILQGLGDAIDTVGKVASMGA